MPKEKKRKRAQETNGHHDVDTSKPTADFRPTGGRLETLSIALPGSIIANAKSHEQKTHLAGTIARALAVFCVDEMIIFEDEPPDEKLRFVPGTQEYTAFTDPSHFLAHLLSYLETPAYLRRSLFPMHPNLKTAGTLPSLDMPHHAKALEGCPYREGVTIESADHNNGTLVDIGFPDPRTLPGAQIPLNTRVTVELDLQSTSTIATAVSPTTPREAAGYYWGYVVRRCPSLSTVFTECPFDGGYDLSLGTSERGISLTKIILPATSSHNHVLIVFGGVAGLEHAAKNDPELTSKGIDGKNVNELFDHWVNLVPGQGSRTIRTEEAVWVGLMGLKHSIA